MEYELYFYFAIMRSAPLTVAAPHTGAVCHIYAMFSFGVVKGKVKCFLSFHSYYIEAKEKRIDKEGFKKKISPRPDQRCPLLTGVHRPLLFLILVRLSVTGLEHIEEKAWVKAAD